MFIERTDENSDALMRSLSVSYWVCICETGNQNEKKKKNR